MEIFEEEGKQLMCSACGGGMSRLRNTSYIETWSMYGVEERELMYRRFGGKRPRKRYRVAMPAIACRIVDIIGGE